MQLTFSGSYGVVLNGHVIYEDIDNDILNNGLKILAAGPAAGNLISHIGVGSNSDPVSPASDTGLKAPLATSAWNVTGSATTLVDDPTTLGVEFTVQFNPGEATGLVSEIVAGTSALATTGGISRVVLPSPVAVSAGDTLNVYYRFRCSVANEWYDGTTLFRLADTLENHRDDFTFFVTGSLVGENSHFYKNGTFGIAGTMPTGDELGVLQHATALAYVPDTYYRDFKAVVSGTSPESDIVASVVKMYFLKVKFQTASPWLSGVAFLTNGYCITRITFAAAP